MPVCAEIVRSTPSKSKKAGRRAKKEAREDKASPALLAALAASKDWFVGQCELHIDSLVRPRPDIAARHLDNKHVEELYASFRKFGSLPSDIMVVLRDTNEYNNFKRDGQFDWARLVGRQLEVVAGSHSTEAIRLLHRDFPNDHLYAAPVVSVYVCAQTEENALHCISLGMADNVKKSIHKKQTIPDCICAMHAQVNALQATGKKVVWSQILAAFESSSGYAPNSVKSWVHWARKQGKVWEYLQALFTGEGLGEGVRPLTSAQTLVDFRGVSDDVLEHILERIVRGTLSWADAKTHAQRLKAQKFLRLKVMEHVKALAPDISRRSDWSEITKLFPTATDAAWMVSKVDLVSNSLKQKLKDLPPEVKAQLRVRADADLAIREGKEPVRALSLVLFVLLCADMLIVAGCK